MTDTSPAAIAAILDGVTPGPWSVFNFQRGRILSVSIGKIADGRRPCVIDSGGFDSTDLPARTNVANARFIAAARDLVPALAAERDAAVARAEAAEAREAALLANNEAERQTLIRHNARHAARVAELTAKLEGWLAVYDSCEIADHVCCCGDDMERHAEPMNCGHVATDHGSYFAGRLAEDTRAALAKIGGE